MNAVSRFLDQANWPGLIGSSHGIQSHCRRWHCSWIDWFDCWCTDPQTGSALCHGNRHRDNDAQSSHAGVGAEGDALLRESGCRTIVRQPATLLMEGDGGPLTVVTACPGKTL